jgi:glycosyltransferase involved in cell wall biosynthesis
VAAEEDFGMSSLEAQVFGKGVIAYGYGGSLETVINGKTGVYFMEQTVQSLEEAIQRFEQVKIDSELCKKNAEKFSLNNFQAKFKKILAEL